MFAPSSQLLWIDAEDSQSCLWYYFVYHYRYFSKITHFPFGVKFLPKLALLQSCQIWNIFTYWHQNFVESIKHWLQIGQAMRLYIYICQKNLIFSFNLWNIWCQTCESLNVNVTTDNSCNSGSLAWGHGYNNWHYPIWYLCFSVMAT